MKWARDVLEYELQSLARGNSAFSESITYTKEIHVYRISKHKRNGEMKVGEQPGDWLQPNATVSFNARYHMLRFYPSIPILRPQCFRTYKDVRVPTCTSMSPATTLISNVQQYGIFLTALLQCSPLHATNHIASLSIVMRHLHAFSLKAAFHIEALIRLRAVKNSFVAANIVGYIVHGMYYPQPKLLALLVSCYCYIFDVAYKT